MKKSKFYSERVNRLIFISDDAIGPVTKNVLVVFDDGRTIDYEGSGSIRELCLRLREEYPHLAGRLETELTSPDKPNNYELVILNDCGKEGVSETDTDH